jgi:hypothetical protein
MISAEERGSTCGKRSSGCSSLSASSDERLAFAKCLSRAQQAEHARRHLPVRRRADGMARGELMEPVIVLILCSSWHSSLQA